MGECTGLWQVPSCIWQTLLTVKCFRGELSGFFPTDALLSPLQNICCSVSLTHLYKIDSLGQLPWYLRNFPIKYVLNFSLLSLRQQLPGPFSSCWGYSSPKDTIVSNKKLKNICRVWLSFLHTSWHHFWSQSQNKRGTAAGLVSKQCIFEWSLVSSGCTVVVSVLKILWLTPQAPSLCPHLSSLKILAWNI